jgi:hypothetical protein
MPYIKKEQREKLDGRIDSIAEMLNENMSDGEYNYVITKLIHNYIKNAGLRYSTLNSAVGILECAKAEFIRTVVSPYEDQKIIDNGFISELDGKKE